MHVTSLCSRSATTARYLATRSSCWCVSATNLPLAFVLPFATGPSGAAPFCLRGSATKILTLRPATHLSFFEVTLPLKTHVSVAFEVEALLMATFDLTECGFLP